MFAIALFLAVACSTRSSGSAGARDDARKQAEELALARSLTDAGATVGQLDRLALARRLEERADREGAGARAVSLHTAAGGLFESAWRVDHRDDEAKAAIAAYRAAARDPATEGACDAALKGARLAGDAADGPAASYLALYRARKRFAGAAIDGGAGACRQEIDRALERLTEHRPNKELLEAIDDELEADGESAPGEPHVARTDAPAITSIESWPGPDAARVVIVLDRPAHYRIGDEPGSTPADARTFLDLDGVDLQATVDDGPESGVVSQVRAERTVTGSRIWLDLQGHPWRRIFDLREPYRVVVDVARRPPASQRSAPRAVTRLILDPGHGGWDRGARGPGGTEEKDVVLDIAQRVAPILAAQGLEVELTRDDDRYVTLEERTAHANAFGADLFVSVHCNASESRAPRGLETYVLDTSRDEIAARVAARENETTASASAELGPILGSLRMADGARRSRQLAQLLLRAATTAVQSQYGDAVNGGVHAAGFYVLVGARMPAVLFETSYISNPVEEKRLARSEYRQLLADAVANGVRAYREGR